MRRSTILLVGVCIAWLAVPASAQAPTEAPIAAGPVYDVAFPDGWIVEHVNEGTLEEPLRVILRAYPGDRSEECRIVDLREVAVGLHALGIDDPTALSHAAADLLGREGAYAKSGLGYSEPWSAYMEGRIEDGYSFALYGYLGRGSWAGLEDDWLVLECWSDATFHQDWGQIARTFAFAIPQATLDSTGPVAMGGLIEVPSVDLAVGLPEGWVAADLTYPEIEVALGSLGPAGDWFVLQLEHGVGDGISQAAQDDVIVAIWAWPASHGTSWPEHCEVTIKEPEWESAAERVNALSAYIVKEGRGDMDLSTLVELPAGEASRFDYRWSSTSGGSDFTFLERGQQTTLACQDFDFGDDVDVATKRDRWLAMAESLRFLSAETAS